jgi:hypothetical protein
MCLNVRPGRFGEPTSMNERFHARHFEHDPDFILSILHNSILDKPMVGFEVFLVAGIGCQVKASLDLYAIEMFITVIFAQ